MSNAFAPRGTQVQHSPDGIAYTTIAEVIKPDFTGSKTDAVDTTNMDSPGNRREFLPTLVDEGDLSLEANFIPGNASQQILDTDWANTTTAYYKVVLPTAGNPYAAFKAFLSSHDYALPIDKQGTRSIKLKITGIVTTTW